ncbi:sensor histidine kinase [Nocardia sp. NBC_01503]|uniref:HAMP domain-containing sensor histidine kinase n=1 Tax=Nocardia sp. NBC_01503 TaxID=2975997 RepID=UPI002E7C1F21|nr:sensor histidine kinase [Nocardia sp. NBC_01503]WTL31391.1 sensor histidine kinase [Nocardia sp. NBC_01503]
MRRRLLIALTVFATLAVLAFAVPLCLTAATSRTQELILGRTGDADRLAALTVTAAATGDNRALTMEVERYHDLYGEPVLVVDGRGGPIVNAGVDQHDPVVASALSDARRNQRTATVARLTPWAAPILLIARPVGSDAHVDGAVLIEASTRTARTDITRVWGIVAIGGLLAMAVFTALALVLSRWVLRPLAGLSGSVAELTASLPKPRLATPVTRHHGGPPELRAVAESFDTMALAVRDSTRAQRRLIDDTAHAMRNPLAALTIRLDSLEPGTAEPSLPTLRGATREVERLTALLDGLLDLAVAEGTDFDPTAAPATESCDAAGVIDDRIDAWHTAFDTAGITLTRRDPAPTTVTDPATALDTRATAHPVTDPPLRTAPANEPVTDPAPHDRTPIALPHDVPASPIPPDHAETAVSADTLAQILDVTLSNSCRYAGPGTTTALTVTREPGWVTVTIADDGVGVPATELDELTTRFFRGSSADGIGGSGLGLSIAAALTTSRKGTLTVRPVDPHGLAVIVRLPAVVRR